MKILMRGDLNQRIGQGHIMRMLSIADAFTQEFGVSCAFVVAKDTLADLIASRGYEVFTLSTSYEEMDAETPELKEIVKDFGAEYLFIDSYYVAENYLNTVRGFCRTVYLDDVYAFAYPVDYLINYNVYAKEEDYLKLYGACELPKFILGATYAPLRKEFQDIPKREQEKTVKNIAVSFGGADPLHMAKAFLKTWIAESGVTQGADVTASDNCLSGKKLHMILGAMEPDLEQIKEIAAANENIMLHINVKNMKEILLDADLAVSAAGSTQYEICACQVPCVNFSMADNQVPGGEEFGRRGIFHYAGDVRTIPDFYEKLISMLKILSSDYEERCRMAEAEYALTDGRGAKRIAGYFTDLK